MNPLMSSSIVVSHSEVCSNPPALDVRLDLEHNLTVLFIRPLVGILTWLEPLWCFKIIFAMSPKAASVLEIIFGDQHAFYHAILQFQWLS